MEVTNAITNNPYYILTDSIANLSNNKDSSETSSENFTDFFINSLSELNSQYISLDEAQVQFSKGEIEAYELMTVLRETELMMKTASTIRNKMLDAYKEITNMQI